MKLNILSDKIAWFGKESGYEPLTDYIPSDVQLDVMMNKEGVISKLKGKILQIILKWKWGNAQGILKEFKFIQNAGKKTVSHILYSEAHLQLLNKKGNETPNLIGTIHMPILCWKEEDLQLLKNFNHAIILYKEEISLFSKYIAKEKLHYIKLGINTNFFKPGTNPPQKNKVLIIGHNMRNFDMLLQVYKRVKNDPLNELEFHILIPTVFHHEFPVLIEMGKDKNVFFHEKLSDQQLLELYQQCFVLLIPMNDSGANTAIVQSLAVGVPVITTDVGGIRSYGGGKVYPIVENNDVEGMVSLFNKYYQDAAFYKEIATKQREFAVNRLDWTVITKQHLELYKTVLN